jgi:choline dehydrogenase-like flavoprotein
VLIDATRCGSETITAQVCIVGSGMGGASVAKKLIESGVDVLIVEAGGAKATRSEPLVSHQTVGRSFGLSRTRALEVGGSTNLWHGICAPLDALDFERRAWIPESGWPLGLEDLAPYYREAQSWLGLTPTSVSAMEAAPAVLDVLAAKAFWTCRSPARLKEVVLGWVQARRARCLVHAVALEFRVDAAGRVRELLVGAGARTLLVRADVFVCAAGGLETPRLLLNSGRSSGRPLGGPLVGRYLMDHPTGYFSQAEFHQPQSSVFGANSLTGGGHLTGFAVRPEIQRRLRLPNHYVFLRPGPGAGKVPNDLLRTFLGVRGPMGLSLGHIKTLLTNRYIRQRVMRERLGFRAPTRFGDIYVMAEQVPNPMSCVRLSDRVRDVFGYPVAEVDWRMTAGEWDHFGAYFDVVADGLRRDARIADVHVDPPDEWPSALSSAAHHLGAARMAATPAHGVVDANLKVFGTSNLFVADAAVFPTAGGTNPSFTISALALRLGGRLARQLAEPITLEAAV